MHLWLHNLGLQAINSGVFAGEWRGSGPTLEVVSPVDGQPIASVRQATVEEYNWAVERAHQAFLRWRLTPAPVRGQTVRLFGEALRRTKRDLARLVTLEMGKILAEAEGEVQEMIDICDFALGLSRQLYGLTIQSERPQHRLMEQWHPLGVAGIISAFNFPVAVWSWNSALAAVCGDAMIWKPSEKTPLSAIAVTNLAIQACEASGADPAIFSLVVGGRPLGERMAEDRRLPLISATGSCAMGVEVAEKVHRRLGRTILELGGNNAVVVAPSANLDLAARAIFFGAVGTAGQRCTTTRRVIIHESLAGPLQERLLQAYRSLKVGNPFEPDVLMGPVVNRRAVTSMLEAKEQLKREGGKVIYGGEVLEGRNYPGGCYVTPCLATADSSCSIVSCETFAPLVYLMTYRSFEEALTMHNAVPQGLSSAIFTNQLAEAEVFVSVAGSDCGIANVNAGTSGAEIGGAFGGEKETGGGRESGSDSWKNYMRRQTSTINYGQDLPLAQGIRFGDQT